MRALSDLKAKLKQNCANHADWAVPKQAQGITTTGSTLDLWSIIFFFFLVGVVTRSSARA